MCTSMSLERVVGKSHYPIGLRSAPILNLVALGHAVVWSLFLSPCNPNETKRRQKESILRTELGPSSFGKRYFGVNMGALGALCLGPGSLRVSAGRRGAQVAPPPTPASSKCCQWQEESRILTVPPPPHSSTLGDISTHR